MVEDSADTYYLAVMRILKRSTDRACTTALSRWFHSLAIKTNKALFSWSVWYLGTQNARELF